MNRGEKTKAKSPSSNINESVSTFQLKVSRLMESLQLSYAFLNRLPWNSFWHWFFFPSQCNMLDAAFTPPLRRSVGVMGVSCCTEHEPHVKRWGENGAACAVKVVGGACKKKKNVYSDTRNVRFGLFLSHERMSSRSATPATPHLLIQEEMCQENPRSCLFNKNADL